MNETKKNLSDKFIGKYMRLAHQIGTDQNPCYSRQIGVVIVDPVLNRILGTGYNGPPPGTPHCDSEEYLRDYFWPMLTFEDKESLRLELGVSKTDWQGGDEVLTKQKFVERYTGCKTCPRRLVKAGPGQRSDLCSCGHAERHAITNAACPLADAVMFCWCGVPCLQCADAIIHCGIRTVHLLKVDGPDYSLMSRWLFKKVDVELIEHYAQEIMMVSGSKKC